MIRLIRSSRSLILGLVIASVGTVACGGGSGGDGIVGPPGGGGGGGGGTVAVASVALAPTTASIQVGSTATLVATTKDGSGNVLTGRTVTWTTSNGSIAAVSNAGVVTGQAPGTATITATSEGKPAQAIITVTAVPVASVTLTSSSSLSSLLVGVVDSAALGSATIVATTKDASGNTLAGRTVSWSSDANSVATVSSAGVVKAVGVGTAHITATSEGKTASVTATVSRPSVARVTVTPPSTSVKVGQTVTVAVALLDAQGHALTGRIINPVYDSSIITLTAGEQITGKAQGSTTIVYTSEGVSGSVAVTVVP